MTYNEGWDEIINHLLDDVGMKNLKFEIVCTDYGNASGNFSSCDKDFAIFNNDFKVQYNTTFKYVYPADKYDRLFQLSENTQKKFFKEIERLKAIDNKLAEKKAVIDMAEKSSFIKDWYAKKFGKIG